VTIGHEDVVEKLRVMPDRVEEIVAGVSEAALRRRPAEGEWSMKEVCGHLVEDARTWQERFVLMTTQTDPFLSRLDPVVSVGEGGYQEAPMGETLGTLRRYRAETVELLVGLSPEDWKRTGRHWSEGRMTIAEACEMGLEHAEAHLEQLRATKEKVMS